MAHFAKLDDNIIVIDLAVINNDVLKDSNGIEQESIGAAFCADLFGGRWVQTSYNANFRKYHASPGMVYDSIKDEFDLPKIEPTE